MSLVIVIRPVRGFRESVPVKRDILTAVVIAGLVVVALDVLTTVLWFTTQANPRDVNPVSDLLYPIFGAYWSVPASLLELAAIFIPHLAFERWEVPRKTQAIALLAIVVLIALYGPVNNIILAVTGRAPPWMPS